MNKIEWNEINSGTHWLNRMAHELGKDAVTEIGDLDAWDWTPAEIALSIMSAAFPNGVTQSSMIHVRLWPWEKAKILSASFPNKLEDFVRTALIEKAMTMETVQNRANKRWQELVPLF